MSDRRSFILGGLAALAAPAIVRAEILMPVRSIIIDPLSSVLSEGLSGTYEAWVARRVEMYLATARALGIPRRYLMRFAA